jgi:hypothetical protein
MRTCERDDCGRKHYAKGLCTSHYQSARQCERWRNDPEWREHKRNYKREWARANGTARQRAWSITNKYGLTVEQYDALMAQPCGICGAASQALDHNHTTGQVRGALCRKCNTGIIAILDSCSTEEIFRGLLWTERMDLL